MAKGVYKNMPKNDTFYLSLYGNILDHYDSNLYSFMAPIIAPLFFPNHDPVVQLIFAYGLLSTSLISRPLGAIFFAYLVQQISPQRCLAITLMGLGLATFCISLLPTYESIGSFAPIALAIIRCIQGFFAGGESCIAGRFSLSQKPAKKHGWYGGLYQSSTVIGILLASFVSLGVGIINIEQIWRIPFILGVGASVLAFYLRWKNIQNYPIINSPKIDFPFNDLIKSWSLIIRLALISSFSYITYVIPFVFLNSFVPLISSITKNEMLALNTAFLFLDAILCPFLGRLSDQFCAKQFMTWMLILFILFTIPAFLLIPHVSLIGIAFIRLVFIFIGLGFLVPLTGWGAQQIPQHSGYMINGIAYNLGSEILGRTFPTVCLFIWYESKSLIFIAIYPVALAFISLFSLKSFRPLKYKKFV